MDFSWVWSHPYLVAAAAATVFVFLTRTTQLGSVVAYLVLHGLGFWCLYEIGNRIVNKVTKFLTFAVIMAFVASHSTLILPAWSVLKWPSWVVFLCYCVMLAIYVTVPASFVILCYINPGLTRVMPDTANKEDRCSFCYRDRAGQNDRIIHHCRTCESCCEGFDHHCHVIGVCVAKGNIRMFNFNLVQGAVASTFSTVICLETHPDLREMRWAGAGMYLIAAIAFVGVVMWAAAFTMFVVHVLIRSTYYEMHDKTPTKMIERRAAQLSPRTRRFLEAWIGPCGVPPEGSRSADSASSAKIDGGRSRYCSCFGSRRRSAEAPVVDRV